MKLRINETPEVMYSFPFTDSKDVYEKMKEYAKADRELFMVMYLNAKRCVTSCELNSIGTTNTSSVFPKEVFRGALLANACAIICIHNHPSGDVTPSAQDRELTKNLVNASALLQITVIDHIILGAAGYFSFADQGLIGDYETEAGKSPVGGVV